MKVLFNVSFILFFSYWLLGCRKSFDLTMPPFSSPNYITINNETRKLGFFPSNGNYIRDNGQGNNPDQWKLVMYSDNDCSRMIGLNDGTMTLYFNIWDKNLSRSQYSISYDLHPDSTKVAITIEFEVYTQNRQPTFINSSALNGILNIIKDGQGKLKSVNFKDAKFEKINGKEINMSCNLVVN